MKSTALAMKLKFSAIFYLVLLFLDLSCVLGIVVQPFQLKRKKGRKRSRDLSKNQFPSLSLIWLLWPAKQWKQLQKFSFHPE